MNNIIAVSLSIADCLNPVGDDGNDETSSPIDNKDCEESFGTGAHSADGLEAIHAPEEEVKATRTVRSPPTPTQQEIYEHRVSHLPYRSWCPECVEAFGRERGHRKQEESRSIPLVSCDYMYLTKNGMFAREELDEDQRGASTRVLIMYCGVRSTNQWCSRGHGAPDERHVQIITPGPGEAAQCQDPAGSPDHILDAHTRCHDQNFVGQRGRWQDRAPESERVDGQPTTFVLWRPLQIQMQGTRRRHRWDQVEIRHRLVAWIGQAHWAVHRLARPHPPPE